MVLGGDDRELPLGGAVELHVRAGGHGVDVHEGRMPASLLLLALHLGLGRFLRRVRLEGRDHGLGELHVHTRHELLEHLLGSPGKNIFSAPAASTRS